MKKPFAYSPDNPRRDDVLALLCDTVRGWGGKCTIVVSDPLKSREQEERYHAMIGDISKQSAPYHGIQLDQEQWKRLLIDAFKEETKDDNVLAPLWASFGNIELLPALNRAGFVMMGEQSRYFPKRLATAFIEFLFAYGAEKDIEFRETRERGYE